MRPVILILLLCCFVTLYSQKNSDPYIDKSIIKIHSFNEDLIPHLLDLNVMPMSCRGAILESNLIVDSAAINFLQSNNIAFSFISRNCSKLIDKEMNQIDNMKKKRNSNWYSTYRNLNEIDDYMTIISEGSSIASKIVIGQTFEGRDISVVKIASDTIGKNKPAIFINGCQHAREWITPMATIYLIEELINQYSNNSEVNDLLNLVDIYVLPVANPDGYVYTWDKDRWWRKNRQPNTGSECVGTDLNRNWNYDWNGDQSTSENPCSYIYVGSAPFSALETQIISDYLLTIPNLVNHIDVHNYSALIVGPWSSSDEPTEDNDEIFCLGTRMQAKVSNTNNYPYIFGTGTVNDLLYLISGGMVDWVYASLSSLSFLYELRPASLYYFNSDFDGLAAFDNDTIEILPTCEEFYQGVIEMIKWASLDECQVVTGCSDPDADNYYCNTLDGNMGCLYNVDIYNPPQSNGAYNVVEYSLPLGFIDDGSCIYSSNLSSLNTTKKIIKTIDLLGREETNSRFIIHVYDNGTVEKKVIY